MIQRRVFPVSPEVRNIRKLRLFNVRVSAAQQRQPPLPTPTNPSKSGVHNLLRRWLSAKANYQGFDEEARDQVPPQQKHVFNAARRKAEVRALDVSPSPRPLFQKVQLVTRFIVSQFGPMRLSATACVLSSRMSRVAEGTEPCGSCVWKWQI